MQSTIETKLSVLNPEFLEVLNESHKHSVPKNSETHFKVTVVSNEFDGARSVKRHQRVYQLLSEQLQQGVHALAIHTFTPSEWQGQSPDSPNCLGGSK
jgi:BolA protein